MDNGMGRVFYATHTVDDEDETDNEKENEMDNAELKYQLEVMQHFVNGGEVQIFVKDMWKDTSSPRWNWADFDYRIKPRYVNPEAASDLLNALEAILADYKANAESGDLGEWDFEGEDFVKAARAAIAKAKGK